MQRQTSDQAAKENFTDFIRRFSNEPPPARHHKLLIDRLEAVERGEITRLMVFMPPGHAKSTYASTLFPAWYMGKHPSQMVIAASHTETLAERFGRRVRNMTDGIEYRRVFGVGLSKDTQAAGRWELDTRPIAGEYFAAGVGGGITGRRADLVIIDDPVKGREDADSLTMREKCWEWYLGDLHTRLKPGNKIILIQTRWHEEDLAGRLIEKMEDGSGEEWEILNLPAVAEPGDMMGRKVGEGLWPEWFGEEFYETEKQVQGNRNWASLYQQRPAPEEGSYFLRENMRYYTTAPMRETMQIYGASDYAVTEGGGDFTVHGVAGLDSADNLFILDWWREQAAPDVWVEELLNLGEQWKPIGWAEEKGQIEKSVGPFIDKRMRERRIYFARQSFTSAVDKPTRGQAIRGRHAQGKVFLPKNKPWAIDLVNEMLHFPTGKYDDGVDVLSLFGRVLDRMVGGTKMKAPDKVRWDTDRSISELFKDHDEAIGAARDL